jgi:hypothetical protein
MPKLSVREAGLFKYLKARRSWVTSLELCQHEFGKFIDWPINARVIMTGCIAGISKKLQRANSPVMIEKQGGGRGGVSYRITRR